MNPEEQKDTNIEGRSGYQAAAARQAQLTKPPGSLGKLEEIALSLAAIQGVEQPAARPAATLIFAADHPVVKHGTAATSVAFITTSHLGTTKRQASTISVQPTGSKC